MQECEATPTQLAQWLGASVGTAAYHVRTLASLGLIELVGETRVRGAVAHHYRALPDSEHLSDGEVSRAAAALQSTPGATLYPLDPEICPVAAAGSFEDENALATRASLSLDAVGWSQLSQACTQLLKHADQIARSSAERMAKNPQEQGRAAGMVLFMFEATSVTENGDTIS